MTLTERMNKCAALVSLDARYRRLNSLLQSTIKADTSFASVATERDLDEDSLPHDERTNHRD
jgi:hypothetical protein